MLYVASDEQTFELADLVCPVCSKKLGEADSCCFLEFRFGDQWFRRDSTAFDGNRRCSDCNILNEEGNHHHWMCVVEMCPKCKRQLITCGCKIDEMRKYE